MSEESPPTSAKRSKPDERSSSPLSDAPSSGDESTGSAYKTSFKRMAAGYRDAARSHSRSSTRSAASASPTPSTSSASTSPSPSPAAPASRSRRAVDLDTFVYTDIAACVEVRVPAPRSMCKVTLRNSVTTLLVGDFLCDPEPGTNWAALAAVKKARRTFHADMANLINARVKSQYPRLQFDALTTPQKRRLVQEALHSLGFQATVRRPPRPTELFACVAHSVQGDLKSLKGYPVCEALPELPANLQDEGVAEALGLEDGRLGGVYLASIERIVLEDHPELPLVFVSFATRLLKPVVLRKPSGIDIRMATPSEYDHGKGGRTSLHSELGLHVYFKESDKEALQKQAEQHNLVNGSLAMGIVGHTAYLSIDLEWSNADIYAWLDEYVEDFCAPFYVPRISDTMNGRAYRAQIFGGAHYWTFNEPSRDKLELIVEDSFEIIRQTQGRVGRQAMEDTQTVQQMKDLVLAAIAERDLEESDERLETPLGTFLSPTEYHRASQTWLIPTEDGKGYYCVCPKQSGLHPRDRVFARDEVWATACNAHGAVVALSDLKKEKRYIPAHIKRHIKRSDGLRGIAAEEIDVSIVDEAHLLPSTIYGSKTNFDYDAISATLASQDLAESEQVARLKELIPGLSEEALLLNPTPLKKPLWVNAVAIIRSYHTSVDQGRQHDDSEGGDGRVLGHGPSSCARIPAYAQQIKRSAPLFDMAAWDCAVAITASTLPAVRKRELCDKITNVLGSYSDLRQACCVARLGKPLDPALAALSREINSLTMEHYVDNGLPELRKRLAAYRRPQPDLQAMTERYAPSAQFRPEVAAHLGEDGERLRETVEAILPYDQLNKQEQTRLLKRLRAFAEKLDDHHGVPKAQRRRNPDGLHVGPFDVKSPTAELLELFRRAFLRAIPQCDIIIIIITRIFCGWDKFGWHCVVYVFITYWMEYGSFDRFSTLGLDLGGEPWSPTRPTIPAHVCHDLPFGADIVDPEDINTYRDEMNSNMTLQCWLTNAAFGSAPGCLLLQRAEWARGPVDCTLRRIDDLIGMTQDEIAIVRDRPRTLNEDQMRVIKVNGVSQLELAGERTWASEEDADSERGAGGSSE